MSSLTERVRCGGCLYQRVDESCATRSGREAADENAGCRHWISAFTGETVTDLALQIRLARARREGCAGCALWVADEDECHVDTWTTRRPADGWCGEWQPCASKEAPHE